MEATRKTIAGMIAAAAVAAAPAHGTSVEDGAFECTAVEKDGSSSLSIVHGEDTLERALPPGSWDEGGISCRAWKGSAVRAVVPGEGGEAYEVFAGESEGSLVAAWEGVTGLGGDFGERWGWFLDWEPIEPGSKETVPILYALHEQVRLCGYGMVPLQVRMYDAASATFRPVSFDRLRRAGGSWGGGVAPSEAKAGGKPVTLTASLAPKGGLPAPPILEGFLRFRSSSSMLGDKGDLAFATAPLALGDAEASTGWVEGSGGPGWGEFVTAVVADRDIAVSSLAILGTRGTSPEEVERWNRVKKIEITTSTGKRFIVKIPSDPAKNPDRPVVVTLPEPVQTQCLSIIIRDVYAAKKGSGDHTYVGEATAYTALDAEGGMAQLLAWFDDTGKADRAADLLVDLHPGAIAAIASAWEGTSPAAQKGVVGAIRAGWAAQLGPLVEKAASGAAEDEDGDIFALLADRLASVLAAGPSPLDGVLEAWLGQPPSTALLDIAVASLGRSGHPAALAALVGHLFGAAEEEIWRPWDEAPLAGWIREGLRRSGAGGLEVADAALGEADLGSEEAVRASLVLLHLLDYAKGGEPVRALAAGWAVKLWEGAPTLFCRHHLLTVASRLVSLGDPAGIDLAARAFGEDQPFAGLRVEALAAIGTAKGALLPAAVETGVAGLSDPDPSVRAAAVSLLRRIGAEGEAVEPKVIALGMDDAWPEVRVEAIRSVGKYEAVPIEAIHDFLRDKSSTVRREAIRLVVDKRLASEEIGILLANTTVTTSLRPDVRAAAAAAIGQLCITKMAMPLANVVFLGISPAAGEGEIEAAAAAAEAIGVLGDAAPVETLIDATRPGIRLEIRLAAIGALGSLRTGEALEALGQISESTDELVSGAARKALASGPAPACTIGP